MMDLAQLPSTDEFCHAAGLRFTRELDETKVKEKLLPAGKIEFAKAIWWTGTLLQAITYF